MAAAYPIPHSLHRKLTRGSLDHKDLPEKMRLPEISSGGLTLRVNRLF